MSWVPAGVSSVGDCVGRPVVVPMLLPSVAMSLQLGAAAAECGQGDSGGGRGAAMGSDVAALWSATVVVSDNG